MEGILEKFQTKIALLACAKECFQELLIGKLHELLQLFVVRLDERLGQEYERVRVDLEEIVIFALLEELIHHLGHQDFLLLGLLLVRLIAGSCSGWTPC